MNPSRLSGRVVRGRGLGRKIGCPTANIKLSPLPRRLPRGVFQVEVSGTAFPRPRLAVCNIGTRPTVDGSGRLSVEVHIPGFRGLLYRKILTIQLLKKIRDENRFPNLEALKSQIQRDIRNAVAHGAKAIPDSRQHQRAAARWDQRTLAKRRF